VCCKSQGISCGIRKIGKRAFQFGIEIAQWVGLFEAVTELEIRFAEVLQDRMRVERGYNPFCLNESRCIGDRRVSWMWVGARIDYFGN
jgi:hypothetical protein